MDKNKLLQLFQIGNIVAVIFTIIVNSLANLLPIGGKNTGELSDNIPNLFVPAGITFSIWGIIYVLIIVFAIYLARDLFKQKKFTTPFVEKTSFFFILAGVANIIWIFLWHYEHVLLSLLAMLVLFVSLLFIYLRLNIGMEKISLKDKLFIHVPISVYIGWITVATIANVTAVLVTVGWNGFGMSEQIWTILVLLIATILTLLVIIKRKDIAYSCVILWAFLGIVIKRFQTDPLQTEIATTALAAICIIIVALFVIFIREHIVKRKTSQGT